MKHLILVFIGGGLGSSLRFLISKALNRISFAFPLGTFSVNIIGSLLLGVILGFALKTNSLNSTSNLLLGVGFCGGFTTFSTFAFENHALLRSGDYMSFVFYSFGSIILGILAVLAGLYISKVV